MHLPSVRNLVIGVLLGMTGLAGCGQNPDPPKPRDEPSVEKPMWNPEHLKVVSCEDIPQVPRDEDVQVALSSPAGPEATAILVWKDDAGSRSKTRQYMLRIKDPTCAERPDIQAWLNHR